VVTPNADGTTFLTAQLRDSNTGLANSTNVDPDDTSATDDDIYVSVSGGGAPPSIVHLTGEVTASNASKLDYDDLTVTAGTGVISCNRTLDTTKNGKTTYTFDCSFTPGSTGSITISGYNSCTEVGKGKNAALTFFNNVISPTTDSSVTGDATMSETTTFTKNISGDTTLNISIGNTSSTDVSGTGSCPI